MANNWEKLWQFETRRFKVVLDATWDDDMDVSWDETGETQEKLRTGEWGCFLFRVRVLAMRPPDPKLRQYRSCRNPVLFLEEYTGIGATTDQFIEIFEKSGIRVVFLDDVLDSPIGRE